MSILQILNELAADNSRLAKEAILKREKDNELLKRVIVAALNPYTNYHQKKIPPYKTEEKPWHTLETALPKLSILSSRELTGNNAVRALAGLLSEVQPYDAEVLIRIIERDLKCGVNEATVNKIWPGLIPTFDVMLSHKDISGIKYPAFAQCKMDGARCHVVWDGKSARVFSRQGKEFTLNGALDRSCKLLMKQGETWDGELLFTDSKGKVLDRKTSNGLANKANKGTISDEEASRVVFVTWDIVDFTSTIPYATRFDTIRERFDLVPKSEKGMINIWKVTSIIVENEDQAEKFFEEMIAAGQEGAILKNIKSVWQPKRTKDLGKMKSEEEADLVVVGWNPGTGKYAGKLGSLICETSDGRLQVNVSGFVDSDREMMDEWVGKIITVRYNAIIKDKKTLKESLFLPRYVETRFDKKVANKFEDLK